MSGRKKFVAAAVLGTLLSLHAFAAEDTPLNASARAAIVQTLVTKMNANYIEPAVAERVGSAIARKNAEGGYASAANVKAFSAALAQDLRELSGDLHFGAAFYAGLRERSDTAELPSRAKMDEWREQAARRGFDIEKIERLPGNIGYIELRGFGGPEFVGAAYTAAMSLMAGTDALILDLRRNGGGSPASVAYLMSHFFPLGDERHLIDMYDRPTDTTRQFWTVKTVAQRYDKPVYVLTSARTFSAGEDFSYGIQAQKRGTVVGETTGGGSNPVSWYNLGQDIIVSIPTARATNAVTKTNWEHVGVKPDIAVPAAQALQAAHVAILRTLVSSAKEGNERKELQRVLAMAEKGESDKPVYTLRGER
ncbi:S41 family peptidase [Janthinobacterium sp. FW305-129]|uniref:S41 family peptidase n=1 Tax=Janthinobacterium sp. FW305-129 TaxID=2775054 RepID=UPI001E48DC0B|nr:S41 family peptidase [Janthinobacterium sp. FW305-129]MCC7596315.1 S41 family peptidase [Janthinobacterium sp. FW305-129]